MSGLVVAGGVDVRLAEEFAAGHLVHRETVSASGGAGLLVRTGGTGATVHNVDGPDPIERPAAT
ncbi:hypothetical protein [Actinomycetospora chibensis]|uniref:Uncharacterized protein n=1 Tax=Actinomycetospora chibensis TaxID=663606 RepID=A0ABV9RQP6_9PSEU|nr:hypothetical protein [Actinomycetospora chibensis]MDD7927838.1 hypothetical protein [Actinomycetospora chibensis]